MSSHDGFSRLDRFARQQFISSLNNQHVEGPVRQAFPTMPDYHPTFHQAILKVRDLYKTWKNRTLKDARMAFDEIAVNDLSWLQKEMEIGTIGQALTEQFEMSWLPRVFGWADEAISFGDCSRRGIRWLRCMPFPSSFTTPADLDYVDASVQLMARARLCWLYRCHGHRVPALCKYDRDSLLEKFDSLHTRSLGKYVTLGDLPLRPQPMSRRRRRRQITNMDEDPDGDIGDILSDDGVQEVADDTNVTETWDNSEHITESYQTDDLDRVL